MVSKKQSFWDHVSWLEIKKCANLISSVSNHTFSCSNCHFSPPSPSRVSPVGRKLPTLFTRGNMCVRCNRDGLIGYWLMGEGTTRRCCVDTRAAAAVRRIGAIQSIPTAASTAPLSDIYMNGWMDGIQVGSADLRHVLKLSRDQGRMWKRLLTRNCCSEKSFVHGVPKRSRMFDGWVLNRSSGWQFMKRSE